MIKVNFEKLSERSFQVNEAYKTLRTNIQFCGKAVKAISFTSCTQNEGKSKITFELSRSMAETGKRVLLIDADIRKSVIISRYGADKTANGLSEYLTDQCELNKCLCDTNINNLNVIFTGRIAPNPSELLGSDKFKELIEEMKEKYDYIFIDCPPLGAVIDAAIVSSVSDGAILLIEAKAISYKFAQRVKAQLEMSGCHILGAVMNKIDMSENGYYGKYYAGYYGNNDSGKENGSMAADISLN